MKRIIALVLVVVTCLAFTSCDRKEKKVILGTWENENYGSFTFEKRGNGESDELGDFKWVYDSKLECYLVSISEAGGLMSFTKVQENKNGKYIEWEYEKFYYKD